MIHFVRQIMLMVPLADKHIEIPSGVMYDDEQMRREPLMRPRMDEKKSRHGRPTEILLLSLSFSLFLSYLNNFVVVNWKKN